MTITPRPGLPTPVRIELATSELEGGALRAWADPGQVLTAVVRSHPRDVFERFVEPRLTGAGGALDALEVEDECAGDSLPMPVRRLVESLREVHARLYRENRSLMRDPRWVELTCAMAEEDRVYFLKGAPAWICVLRDGRAWPAGRVTPTSQEEASSALGKSESLGFEITSLPVQPGDTVVVLASEDDVEPDLRAVQNLFGRTTDLKRACDGLVNLLGLQSPGASAVALRFLPIAAATGMDRAENPLAGLAEEFAGLARSSEEEAFRASLDSEAVTPAQAFGAYPDGADESAIDLALDEALASERGPRWHPGDTAILAGPGPDPTDPPDRPPGGMLPAPPSAREAPIGRAEVPVASQEPEGALVGADAAASPPAPPRRSSWLRRVRLPWLVILGSILLGSIAFVAIPLPRGGSGIWPPGDAGAPGGSIGTGVLSVEPEPPARAVLVDGVVVAEGTPVRLDAIPAGTRRIGLDLGPCGIWETTLAIAAGAVQDLSPRLTGSVELVAADPTRPGRAWTMGREKTPLPVRVDSLPVGWNRIFYEDDRLPMWDRLVLIKADQASRVTIPNDFASANGVIRVEALLFQEGEGLVASEGDTVWVDGRTRGLTPIELTIDPGLHSIRVGSAATGYHAEVLETRAGCLRYVQAEIGRGERPALRHVSPGKVVVRGPLALNVAVVGGGEGPWTKPTLHLPELPPGLREIPLSAVEGKPGVFAGVIGPDALPAGGDLAYFFTIVGPDGELVWSDLYRLTPSVQWAGAGAGAGEPARF